MNPPYQHQNGEQDDGAVGEPFEEALERHSLAGILLHDRSFQNRACHVAHELGLNDETLWRVTHERKRVARDESKCWCPSGCDNPDIVWIDDVRLLHTVVKFTARRDDAHLVLQPDLLERPEQAVAVRGKCDVAFLLPWKGSVRQMSHGFPERLLV